LALGTESVSETAWALGTALAWVWVSASPPVWASDLEWASDPESGWESESAYSTESVTEPASASGRASDRASDRGSEEVSGVTELALAPATSAESAPGPAWEWLPVAVATSSRPERPTCRYNS
jgi:hypothetical protein